MNGRASRSSAITYQLPAGAIGRRDQASIGQKSMNFRADLVSASDRGCPPVSSTTSLAPDLACRDVATGRVLKQIVARQDDHVGAVSVFNDFPRWRDTVDIDARKRSKEAPRF